MCRIAFLTPAAQKLCTDLILHARSNALAKDVCFRTQEAKHCLAPRRTEMGRALHLLLIKGLSEKPQTDTQLHHAFQCKQELGGVLLAAASVLHLYEAYFRGTPYGLIY